MVLGVKQTIMNWQVAITICNSYKAHSFIRITNVIANHKHDLSFFYCQSNLWSLIRRISFGGWFSTDCSARHFCFSNFMDCRLVFCVSPKILSVTNYSFASAFCQAKARKHAKTVFQVIFNCWLLVSFLNSEMIKIWHKIIENQVFDFEVFYWRWSAKSAMTWFRSIF